MRKRFLFESIIGAICLLAVLFFGTVGFIAFALLALLPMVARNYQPDERELQLFYKTGNLTMGLSMVGIYLVYLFSGISINGHLIGNNWMPLCITTLILIHGISGLVLFRSE